MRLPLLPALALLLAGAGCSTVIKPFAWHSIHDGRTLKDWSAPDMSFWRVEDGAITGETTREHQPPRTQFLVWQGGRPANFELKFEFRIFGPQANSGMQFRSEVKEQGLVYGYQADIDASGKYLGGLWDEFSERRSLAARGERTVIDEAGKRTITRLPNADQLLAGLKTSEWNEYHIRAVGPQLTLWINDRVVAEVTDRQAGEADAAGVLATAIIGGEPMKVQLRNLVLREL